MTKSYHKCKKCQEEGETTSLISCKTLERS